MALRIYPYKKQSKTYKELIRINGLRACPKRIDKYKGPIFNFGSSSIPIHLNDNLILNEPEAVKRASNKRLFFRRARGSGLSVVPSTESREVAEKWITEGFKVCIRQKLTGHSGEGLTVVSKLCDMKDAPLYTLYKPKKREFRVKVFDCEYFSSSYITEKKRTYNVPNDKVDWEIRTHKNGFIYSANLGAGANELILRDLAKRTLKLYGLDFGAVDILWSARERRAYVIEVNTAPGMEGSSLSWFNACLKYVESNIRYKSRLL